MVEKDYFVMWKLYDIQTYVYINSTFVRTLIKNVCFACGCLHITVAELSGLKKTLGPAEAEIVTTSLSSLKA